MEKYKQLIEQSFENAELGNSKITNGILSIQGMSGTKTRHFYNNLLSVDGMRYLEIGTWKGSSVCSAMCGNNNTVVCIDNWSEFGGPKEEFLTNFNKFKGDNDARFIEDDCYNIDISTLQKFNIYMYDGNHTEDSHYRALKYYYECLDDVFIYIVDDWNCKEVRDGTERAIKELKCNVMYQHNIRLTWDDTHTPFNIAETSWWNGIFVAILQK
jgi:hypothetical protein